MPRLVSPKNDAGIEYFDLLSMIDARLVSGCDIPALCRDGISERLYWIRHDVDHDVFNAIRMAKAEWEKGYRSTYLFLHTAKYWWTDALEKAVNRILDLGHDIGVHNNAVTQYLDVNIAPAAVIDCAISRLKGYGARVRMTSAHGDRKCRERCYCNYEMWFDCPVEYSRAQFKIPKESLATFGMVEAYFTRRDAYLTDSGHKWRGWVGREHMPPFEAFENYRGPVETIEAFNRMDSGVMQLLVHPFWWWEEEPDAIQDR